MIGFLSGEVVARDDPHIIINVNGVGYKVLAANSVLSKVILNGKLKLLALIPIIGLMLMHLINKEPR